MSDLFNRLLLMKIRFFFLLIFTSVFLASCANINAYEGEPEKKQNTALIKGVSPWFAISPIGIVIKAVDGKKVNRFISQVRVTEGFHQLDVVCHLEMDGQRFFSRHNLEVSVEENKIYHLYSQRKGEICQVFIE